MPKWTLLACLASLLAPISLPGQARDLPMLVDVAWLAENLDVSELVVVHLAADRREYDGGHIPGARFLAYDRMAIHHDGTAAQIPRVELLMLALGDLGIHDETYVVVYGDPFAATRAWMVFDYLGLSERAAILDGGLSAWRAANQPLTTDTPSARGGNFSLWPNRERVVDADWLLPRLEHPDLLLLDTRSPEANSGRPGTDPRDGRIPGARNLPRESLLRGAADRRFAAEGELRLRFEAVGATPSKAIVVYDDTATDASLAYFAARLLGYETRLYEGAWSDWVRRGLPTARGD